MPIRIILFIAALALAPGAFAAETAAPRYNAVSLQADAQREVPNDLLNALLYVEVNDASAAAAASAVNKTVNAALRAAKEHKSVSARSGSNRTFPVYSRGNVLQAWRGRGEIRIESRDFEAAAALIGKLQSSMQLGNLQFTVSGASRRAAENELITEAIAAFKSRAEIIRTSLGGRGYKLQSLNVSGGHHVPQPRFAVARAAASPPEVAPPALESGVSVITVTASGTIELLE